MVSSSHRAALAAALLATPVALLGACTPNQPPSNTPGTTPAIWTGSVAPSASQAEPGGTGVAESLSTVLKAADGTQVATAEFQFNEGSNGGYVTVTVHTTSTSRLSPGFHGLHIHGVGKCEPNSVGAAGGAPGDFLSAGGHFQAPGHDGNPQSGDLTSLQVRQDGSSLLVTTTDAFSRNDLVSGDKTAIIIHEDDDNFANIPADRYTQVNGTPGPDQTTLSTGDAGKRVACGVIGSG